MTRPLSHNAFEPRNSVIGSVVNRPASSRSPEIPEFNVGSEVPADNRNPLPIKLIARVVYERLQSLLSAPL